MGKLEGFRAGKLQGKREVLLRLMARAGAIAEADRGRVALCTDAETLDRWIDDAIAGRGNVLG